VQCRNILQKASSDTRFPFVSVTKRPSLEVGQAPQDGQRSFTVSQVQGMEAFRSVNSICIALCESLTLGVMNWLLKQGNWHQPAGSFLSVPTTLPILGHPQAQLSSSRGFHEIIEVACVVQCHSSRSAPTKLNAQ